MVRLGVLAPLVHGTGISIPPGSHLLIAELRQINYTFERPGVKHE